MSPRWLYLALAVGAGLGAALTAASDTDPAPAVSGAVRVPFELNDLTGTCDVTVTDGVVGLVACEIEEDR